MFRIRGSTRSAVVAGVLLLPTLLSSGAAVAMGDAHHDLARDMATGVYGVPYDGPKVPGAPPAAERTPKGATDAPARARCESGTGKADDCRDEVPRRKSP